MAKAAASLGVGVDYDVGFPAFFGSVPAATSETGKAESMIGHEGRKLFRGYAAVRHPEDPFDAASGVGQGRRLLFQEVPEAKSGKNRLHIDVHSEPDGFEELVARLEGLGATREREVDQGPAGHWWVMRDPEGNEFCVA